MTQFVKLFPPGSQLQRVQSFKAGASAAYLRLSLFPTPKYLLFARNPEGLALLCTKKPEMTLNRASHPVDLYLKAHFANHRLNSSELFSELGLRLIFGAEPELRVLELDFSDKGYIKVHCLVPGRKPYSSRFPLGTLSETLPNEALKPPNSKLLQKQDRLLKNVSKDVEMARQRVETLAPVVQALKGDPTLWIKKDFWSQDEKKEMESWCVGHGIRPWESRDLKVALEKFFRDFKRQERKMQRAGLRLKELQSLGTVIEPNAKLPDLKPPQKFQTARSVGIWVPISDTIMARVGRSAKENDQLLREASSHDLWFHVRGLQGAHVWVPRGQKAFSKNDAPTKDLIDKAAQLAIINSKARSSGSAAVDYTEKRYLKKIKGTPGAVRILRSDSVFVRIDPEFERKVFRGV